MDANGFGPIEFWPPTSRYQLKRTRHSVNEIPTFSINPNPNEVVDNKPTLLSDLGNNLKDNNIIHVIGISVNSQSNQIGKIPAQKHKKSLKFQNEDLTLFDELRLNRKESIFVSAL